MNLKTLQPILKKLYSIKKIKKPSSAIEEGFFIYGFNFLTLVIESQKRHGKYE
jgi:hypothetical protein